MTASGTCFQKHLLKEGAQALAWEIGGEPRLHPWLPLFSPSNLHNHCLQGEHALTPLSSHAAESKKVRRG